MKEKESRRIAGIGRTGRLLFCLGIGIMVSQNALVEGNAWDGIPKIKVPQIGVSSMNNETTKNTEYPVTEDEGDPTETLSELNDQLVFASSDYTEELPPILTDLEDLEAEWKEFDKQWEKTKEISEHGKDSTDQFHAIVMARSLRALIWPVTLAFGSLAISGMIITTLCLTRRQIYCCGQPCFDSSLEAASTYDRTAMRREKIKMIKKNPLATRSLDQTEIEGIVECLRKSRSRSRRETPTEEFMQEFERRFPGTTSRTVSSPSRNSESHPTQRIPEEFTITHKKLAVSYTHLTLPTTPYV